MGNFDWEHCRMIFVTAISPILGYLTPTEDFIYALIIMFAFNIWAGMRADGISIICCKNFSFKKFGNALAELILYLVIVELIFTIMSCCGDKVPAVVAVKSLTYVFGYVYLQNSFKNLIIAYPDRIALRIIYHVIRLEFTRALPSHIRPVIERVERDKDIRQHKNERNGKNS